MGNVLRVLGIVVASMLLGLVALFLVLFSICGGLESSGGGGVLAVCLLLIVGGVGLIVVLGRGLAASRSTSRGLAVGPAGAPAAYPANAPAAYSPGRAPPDAPQAPATGLPAARAAARPVVPLRPLGGTDLQVLIGLRIALAVYILLSVGSMVSSVANVGRYGGNVAIQLILRSILGVLPSAAVLLAVSIRNPPAGPALDAAAGMGIASILFRFVFLAFSGLFTSLGQIPDVAFMFLRLGVFSALEAAIAGMAIYLRGRTGPLSPAALIVAVVAFLFWAGLVQAAMQALLLMMY
jgi:hypothetical protein